MFKKGSFQIVVKYSLWTLLGEYVYLHVLYRLGVLYSKEGLILGYLTLVFLFAAFYLCLNEINKKLYNNDTPIGIMFFHGMMLAIGAALLYLTCYNIELYILHSYPHQEMLEKERIQLITQKLSIEKIESILEKKRAHYFTIEAQISVVKWFLGCGLVLSALVILIFKTTFYFKKT